MLGIGTTITLTCGPPKLVFFLFFNFLTNLMKKNSCSDNDDEPSLQEIVISMSGDQTTLGREAALVTAPETQLARGCCCL